MDVLGEILITDFTEQRLRPAFGERIRFIGLQGSFRRGEQTFSSDLDVVVILDRLDPGDLIRYREAAAGFEEWPNLCGFLCGTAELKSWPRYDLFTLYFDTEPVVGCLSDWIASPGADEAREYIRIGAAGLFHETVHRALYGQPSEEALFAALKSARFLVAAREYLRTGRYEGELARLAEQCTGLDRVIVSALREHRLPEDCAGLLLRFCQECLEQV